RRIAARWTGCARRSGCAQQWRCNRGARQGPKTHRGGIPGAVSEPCDDGAAELHGACDARQGRDLGADAERRGRARGGRGGPGGAGAGEVPPEKVVVNKTMLGGGLGGRGAVQDFVKQAVLVAKAVGQPVKLLWTREEDIRHDFSRPAAMARFTAGLDASGMP